MAFVSSVPCSSPSSSIFGVSLSPANRSSHVTSQQQQGSQQGHHRAPIQAIAKRRHNNNANNSSDDNINNRSAFRRHNGPPRDFEPFDGSQPLLPPWRPPSLEQDFAHKASRITRREAARTAPMQRLVRVDSPGYATLFAHVIQQGSTGAGRKRVWIRPLLLDGHGNGEGDGATSSGAGAGAGFLDVRGGSDLVLDGERVVDVDGGSELAMRLRVNLAATEADVSERAAFDDQFSVIASKALVDFVTRLRSGNNVADDDAQLS